MASKKLRGEALRNAEKKYQMLIQKRDELNEAARVVKEERDMLNAKKKELLEEMKKLKELRNKAVEEMRKHKELRNQLQQQAKELIQQKRKNKKGIIRSLPLKVEELKADIQMLEYKQETTPLSKEEEDRIIDNIRKLKVEYERLKKELEKQKLTEIDLSDKEKAIDELFKKADAEHEQVQKCYQESQKYHEKFIKVFEEVAALINEANKKHEEYMEIKKSANEVHRKVVEMRAKIISIKKESRRRREEAKKILEEQNLRAKKMLYDEKKLEEHTEAALDALKQGEKVALSGQPGVLSKKIPSIVTIDFCFALHDLYGTDRNSKLWCVCIHT